MVAPCCWDRVIENGGWLFQVSIALEEMGFEYDAHTIDIMKGDQFTPEFIAVNPNSKIPAILDPNGPGRR